VNLDFLRLSASDPVVPAVPARVRMYRLAPLSPSVANQGNVTPRSPNPEGIPVKPMNEKELTLQPLRDIELQKPEPVEFKLNKPAEYQQNKLNDEFKLD
jgi:hypothetical protein